MSHAPFAIGKPRTLLEAVIGTAIAYIGVLDSHRYCTRRGGLWWA
jgi:hypothetical protein